MTRYQKTKVLALEDDKQVIMSEAQFHQASERMKLLKTMTFEYKEAQTIQDCFSLCHGDESLFIKMFNYSAGLLQDKKANRILQSDESTKVGVIDVSSGIMESI